MYLEKIKSRYQRLYIVHNLLRDARLVVGDLSRETARRKIGREIFSLPETVRIDPRSGYAVCRADEIPGLAAVAKMAAEFALARQDEPEVREATLHKPFYFNILDRLDQAPISMIVDFALSNPMLRILTPYYGLLPNLSHIGIFLSQHTNGPRNLGSQKLHWDNHDRRHVKMFTYLSDVGENDGPLTFLPAEKSMWFRRKTGRLMNTFPVKEDAEFRRYFSERDLVTLIGPVGTTAFFDTTRCAHFGSRCEPNGRRRALVIHYTRFAEYSFTKSKRFEDINVAASPELRPSSLSRAANLVYHLV